MADLRQLSDEEFAQLADGLAPDSGNSKPTGIADALAPATQAALADSQRRNTVGLASIPASKLNSGSRAGVMSKARQDAGERSGIPLDSTSGAPAGVRLSLGFDDNELNQFKSLNEKYGPGNVDISNDGRFILRNQPTATGGRQDIMVDPSGLDTGDFAEMGAKLPEMAAGVLGARFGGQAAARAGMGGVGKAVGTITGMALAQEAQGGMQDALVRGYRGDSVNLPEIAVRRGEMALKDEALGFIAAGGAKVASKIMPSLFNALGAVKELPTATKQAAQQLEEGTGVKYPLTPGQESQSGLALRAEAIASQRLGSIGVMEGITAEQQAAESELRRVFLGMPRSMTDDELAAAMPQADDVGNAAMQRLREHAAGMEGDVLAATKAVQQAGTEEVKAVAGIAAPLDRTAVGKMARDKVKSEMAAFRNEMDPRYSDFLSKPEITNRTMPGNELAKAADDIEEALTPMAEKTKTKTVITNPIFGTTATTTSTSLESLDAFVNGKVKSFISELQGLRGARVGINDLKQIRTAISDSIDESVAIRGTPDKQLLTIKKAVDDRITKALDALPDLSIKTEWEALNADWQKGISRFDPKGIQPMLVKEGVPGSVGNAQIADSIAGDSARMLDHYNELKAFFGANSPEFKALQQAARENILTDNGVVTLRTGYIKGDKLVSRLENLDKDVRKELFGTTVKDLAEIGDILKATKGNLDLGELSELARGRTLTAAKLKDLINAETARVKVFNNSLISDASDGLINAEKIQPSTFVRSVSRMDPDNAAKVLGALSYKPELLQDIRRLAIDDIWSAAQAGTPGKEQISSQTLKAIIADNTPQGRTWRLMIGNDAFEGLLKLAKVASTREVGAAAKSMGGSIGGANDMAKVFMHGEVGALPAIASRAFITFLYSGPMKGYATQLLTSQDASRFVNAVVASTPFIEHILEHYGSGKGALIMNELRGMVEPAQQKSLFIKGQIKNGDLKKLSPEEFDQWLKNTAKQ